MHEQYLALVQPLIALRSISTDPAYESEMLRTATFLSEQCEAHGFTAEVVPGYGNPVVLATYMVSKTAETCLIYGHYDVQPAAVEEGWHSDPFILTERDGRLVGRGAIDNKGQFAVHLSTIFDLIQRDKLGYNITLVIEGDEESGSGLMSNFVAEYRDKLAADFIVISDGELTGTRPTIELGFRGIFNATISLTTSTIDLHSGLYGGAVPNAAHELAKLVAQLHDAHHHVTVPGFYEGAENPSDQQLAACEAVPYTEAEFLTLTGTKAVIPEPGFGVHAQIGLRPTLQVTSFTSGYQGVGYRNSIPAAATVKINARLGANQDPLVIREALTKFLQHHVPSYCDLKVTVDQLAKGVELEVDAAPVQRAARILEEVYGEALIFKYCGALIPIVTDFATELGVPQVLIPLANEDCHMHAANENFSLTALEYALSFSEKFFSRPEVS